MKRKPEHDENTTVLRRCDKHCHVVVTPEIHAALTVYAATTGLTMCAAASRLIRASLLAEINVQDGRVSRDIAELKRKIRELCL